MKHAFVGSWGQTVLDGLEWRRLDSARRQGEARQMTRGPRAVRSYSELRCVALAPVLPLQRCAYTPHGLAQHDYSEDVRPLAVRWSELQDIPFATTYAYLIVARKKGRDAAWDFSHLLRHNEHR